MSFLEDEDGRIAPGVADVARLIAAEFPEWRAEPVVPILPGGWSNRCFRLGRDKVVRLPSARRYADQVPMEKALLPALAPALPLAIPQPLAMGVKGEGYPWPWLISQWIPGAPVCLADLADPVSTAERLAGFLGALQQISLPADLPTPWPGPRNFHRGGDLAIYAEETEAALRALGARIDQAGARALWDRARAARWTGAPVLLHGDLAPDNLLQRDGDLIAVIDFGNLALGDPACDLTIAWTLFEGPSRAAFRAALPLDAATWARARGWALWKAAKVLAGQDGNPRQAATAQALIATLVAEHRHETP